MVNAKFLMNKNGKAHPFRLPAAIMALSAAFVILAAIAGLIAELFLGMSYDYKAGIPVYKDIVISGENPETVFANPTDNTGTLMLYTLTYTEGTDITIIWASDEMLAPGQKQSVNLHELIEPDEYPIGINITLCDKDTGAVILNSRQETSVTVK